MTPPRRTAAAVLAPTLDYRDPTVDPRAYHNRLALVVAAVAFSALSLWCAVKSAGFLEADAMTHYMFARFSFREWSYFVNVWGRPLCTGVYAIPANVAGVLGARVTSLAMALATALIVYRVARRQGFRMPAIAAIALLAQPLYFAHSFSELTEIPFALVAVAAFWAYQGRRFALMALLVGVTPTGRPEGIGLMLLAAIALVAHRRPAYLLILPLPCAAWSFLGALSWGPIEWWPYADAWYTWLPRNWPYAARSAYGSGRWFYFVGILPVLLSPLYFPFLWVGIAYCVRAALGRDPADAPGVPRLFSDHRARCEFVYCAIPVGVLLGHTFLWTFGLMASSGEPRYLLSVAPFWALVVGRGWEWVWERFRLPVPFLVAALFASPPVVVNAYYKHFPLRIYDNDLMGKAVAQWYASTPGLAAEYPRVIATPPSVYFFMDLSQSDPQRGAAWNRETARKLTPGTILIWDPVFGLSNASRDMIVPKEEIEAMGWVWIGNVVYGGAWCNVYLSPRTLSGAPTDPAKFPAPGDATPDRF
jgi:hypothetical protein